MKIKDEKGLEKLANAVQAFYGMKVLIVPYDVEDDSIAKLNIVSATDKLLVELEAMNNFDVWQIVGSIHTVTSYYWKELVTLHKSKEEE